jgi:hypothetical protein
MDAFMEGGEKRHWFNIRSPKGLNTILPADVYRLIKSKYGRICVPLAPDFCMAFTLLTEIENLNYISSPVLYSRNEGVSNGKRSRKNKEILRDYLRTINYSDEDSYKFTPIPIAGVFNCMYNDLFALTVKHGWKYSWKDVNMVEYFFLIYSEIIENEFEQEKKEDLLKWKEALEKQPENIQKTVMKKTISDNPKPDSNGTGKGFLSKLRRLIR